MARLADVVGVSRQTVYNEVGSKPRLAEAMILRELERFLGAGRRSPSTRTPTDLVAAIRDASCAVLEASQDNLLLHAHRLGHPRRGHRAAAAADHPRRRAALDRQGGGGRPGRAVRRRPRRPRELDAAIDMVGPRGAQPRHAALGLARAHGRRHRLDLGAGPESALGLNHRWSTCRTAAACAGSEPPCQRDHAGSSSCAQIGPADRPRRSPSGRPWRPTTSRGRRSGPPSRSPTMTSLLPRSPVKASRAASTM